MARWTSSPARCRSDTVGSASRLSERSRSASSGTTPKWATLRGGRRHDLDIVLHVLATLAPLGDLRGGGLRLFRVDLAAQVDFAFDRLDAHLAALDSVVCEERDLGLRCDPAVADRALHALRG